MQTQLKSLSFKTPWFLYAMHRVLFRKTNGIWNDFLSKIISIFNPKYTDIDYSKSIFKFDEKDVKNISSELSEFGYAILPFTLSAKQVESIMNLSQNTPVRCVMPIGDYKRDGIQYSNSEISVAAAANKFARCVHDAEKLSTSNDIINLLTEPLLLAVSQEYLGAKPILGSYEMWWSFPVEDREKFAAASAQKYHFDMDHIKFLNFFFYITDVDGSNGPHCYVKKSHRSLPAQFRKRGRFQDSDIEQFYKNDVVEIQGKRGTIIAVDTRGIHKGKILESGSRLLLQIRFTNSLFGQVNKKVTIKNSTFSNSEYVKRHQDTFFHML